ncbi:MAG: hypothetical protein IJ213_03805 [Bacteroidales bacterium]|nr:hypothetical protein [Bacteroidales bacterium]
MGNTYTYIYLGYSISIASFPDFALHFKTDIFFIETKSEYLAKFLIPLIVFVFAFMTDFYISLRSYKIGNRKSYLLKVLVFLLVVAFGIFLLTTIFTNLVVQIVLFLLLWLNIALIKAITYLIPGKNKISVTKPKIK